MAKPVSNRYDAGVGIQFGGRTKTHNMCLLFESSVVAKLVEDGIKEEASLLSRIMGRRKGKSSSQHGRVMDSARETDSIEMGSDFP